MWKNFCRPISFDDDVLAFVSDNIDKLKLCHIPEEFKEKIKELAEATLRDEEDVVNICNVAELYEEEDGTVDENTEVE